MAVQQPVRLSDVVLIATGTTYRVNQTEICIRTNMSLHAKVPLVTLAFLHASVKQPLRT